MVPSDRGPYDTAQIKLRLREELRRRLQADAEAKKTSLNSAIVERLEQSLLIDQIGMEKLGLGTATSPAVREAAEMFLQTLASIEFITKKLVFGPRGDSRVHRMARAALEAWFDATAPSSGADKDPLILPNERIGAEIMRDFIIGALNRRYATVFHEETKDLPPEARQKRIFEAVQAAKEIDHLSADDIRERLIVLAPKEEKP